MADIALTLVKEFWAAAAEMAPYLLFGFFVAGVLSVLVSQEAVERHIGRKGLLSVFKASMFGVPLPLCSCGVIPVGMSLRKHGASRDATVAFLISTPQTGVDSIMVTLSMLGPVFAVIRPVAALITGMAGGILTTFFGEKNHAAAPAPAAPSCGPSCADSSCGLPPADTGKLTPAAKFAKAMRYGFVTLPVDIGKFLFAGLIIAAFISAIVPDNFFSTKLNSDFLQMMLMMAIGIPMYVCSSASVPVAAALMHAGISPGAALVFLMTGPATNAATISAIWNVLGRRTTIIYLAAIASGALAFGYFLNALNTVSPHHLHMGEHFMMPQYIDNISAVVLFAVLAQAFIGKKKISAATGAPPEVGEQTMELDISGMSCSHCVANATKALSEVPGVTAVNVVLTPGHATVTGKGLDRKQLVSAVEQLGYKSE